MVLLFTSCCQTVSTLSGHRPGDYELTIILVPSTVKWLSEDEKSFVQGRLPINSPKSSDKDFDWQEFKNTFKDYRLWLFLGVWGFYTVGTTGLTFYQPSIIAQLGFT